MDEIIKQIIQAIQRGELEYAQTLAEALPDEVRVIFAYELPEQKAA